MTSTTLEKKGESFLCYSLHLLWIAGDHPHQCEQSSSAVSERKVWEESWHFSAHHPWQTQRALSWTCILSLVGRSLTGSGESEFRGSLFYDTVLAIRWTLMGHYKIANSSVYLKRIKMLLPLLINGFFKWLDLPNYLPELQYQLILAKFIPPKKLLSDLFTISMLFLQGFPLQIVKWRWILKINCFLVLTCLHNHQLIQESTILWL